MLRRPESPSSKAGLPGWLATSAGPSLARQISAGADNLMVYGVTPPLMRFSVEETNAYAHAQKQLVAELPIDGLLIYDLQDESSRITTERPYPFRPRMASIDYALEYWQDVPIPKVIYYCVSRDHNGDIDGFLSQVQQISQLCVLVGAPSSGDQTSCSVEAALQRGHQHNPQLVSGGVVIPERHLQKHTEHQRMMNKASQGCGFFVSQAVFDLAAFKTLLTDYAEASKRVGLQPNPVFMSLVPCDCEQTLAFIEWLGISVPESIHNVLLTSRDMVATSVELAIHFWQQAKQHADNLGVPLSCNVESLSARPEGVAASVALVQRIRAIDGVCAS